VSSLRTDRTLAKIILLKKEALTKIFFEWHKNTLLKKSFQRWILRFLSVSFFMGSLSFITFYLSS